MNNKSFLTIDGMPVEICGEKNLLELIRKAGIELPTFCYHSELSIHGACRMCMVENQWGSMEAACSTPPKPGMVIRTHTERLRKHRKMILELLLADHCRDCTTCRTNGKCRLQELARRFDIHHSLRFTAAPMEERLDLSSPCIVKNKSKCILCGDCVRMCNEVQNVGAIDFAHRGAKMTISTAFDIPLGESNCVGCGQCAAVCPTGAIRVRNNVTEVWTAIDNAETYVVAQIAPAVRAAVGKEFGLENDPNAMGRIVAALRRMGFDEVFDTSSGADLTVLEESGELIRRLDEHHEMPLFTSCCPAWVRYAEKNNPELLPHISTCRSPMQMFASVIQAHHEKLDKRLCHVAIMPCTAKKFEAEREEFRTNGKPNVDYVLTTQEIIQMIRESGLIFAEIEPEAVDMPFAAISGAGVIFGVTGGVTEAVLRRIAEDKSAGALHAIGYSGMRGMNGVKELELTLNDRSVKGAIVSGLGNAAALIERIKSGEHYDFVEVMACPGGCVGGAGQPPGTKEETERRGKALYAADKLCSIKCSEENPLPRSLYQGLLKGRSHELLHVDYVKNNKPKGE